jgi:hypothetical protein
MKKLLLIILSATLICNYVFSVTPPEVVKKAFDKKFPASSDVTWSKENVKEWEAEFTFEGNKLSANFAVDGTWIETEQAIAINNFT